MFRCLKDGTKLVCRFLAGQSLSLLSEGTRQGQGPGSHRRTGAAGPWGFERCP